MKCHTSALWGVLTGLVVTGCAPDLQVSGTGGEGGGAAGGEICSDGVDNDGDTLIDCADTANCKNLFSCQPGPPLGWTYVHIRRPPFGEAEMPCSDGNAPMRFFEEPAKAECAACMCQAQGTCHNGLDCYAQIQCAGMSATKTVAAEGQCLVQLTGFIPLSCKVSGSGTVPPGATCSAEGGGLMNPNPFMKEVHMCPAPANAAGCGTSTCVAVHPEGYENKLCIAQAGTASCPAGFSELHSTFLSSTDTRQCSPCVCDASQINCSGPTTFAVWDDIQCTKNSQLVTSANGCVSISGNPFGVVAVELPNQSIPKAGCTGGVASGAIVPQEPMTICCDKL